MIDNQIHFVIVVWANMIAARSKSYSIGFILHTLLVFVLSSLVQKLKRCESGRMIRVVTVVVVQDVMYG